jgi:hypothetical protein
MLSQGFCRTLGARFHCVRPLVTSITQRTTTTSCCPSSASAATPTLSQHDDMETDDAISGLQPALLWRYFKDLTQIPRPSKHELRWAWGWDHGEAGPGSEPGGSESAWDGPSEAATTPNFAPLSPNPHSLDNQLLSRIKAGRGPAAGFDDQRRTAMPGKAAGRTRV